MLDRVSKSNQFGIRPWGILTASGAVLVAATVFGFFGRFWWFLDLFSHFRVQYLLGLLVLGVLLFIGHRRRTAAVFLLAAVANLVPILPLYFGGSDGRDEIEPSLRAMLLNVNTRLGDAGRVKSIIAAQNPDLIVLEEINSRWLSDLAWITNAYPHTLAHPREDNFGIGLFSKLPLDETEVAYVGSSGVPTLLATVRTGASNLRVVATHPLPPGGRVLSRLRNEQLAQLPDYLQSPLPILLLGDLNVTPWNFHFRRLLARSGLRDSARGFGVQPTWPNGNPFLRIPLDHCLHSADIRIIGRKVGDSVSSDHYPLFVDFAILQPQAEDGS
ncbi:MAG: endonuclease/exonuclease/phosphatase family protein [Kiritimatiellae bacterium]|nr:endonuclease/exonuclease/phosphatase family protein [Kiritimatiellia bacterium]